MALVEPRMSLRSRLSPEVSSFTIVYRPGPSVLKCHRYSQCTEDVNQAQLTKNMGPLPCAKLFAKFTVSTSSPHDHRTQNREEQNKTLPRQVIRRPLQPKRHPIPNSKINRRKKAHRKRKIHNRRPQLQRIARPAINQRRHNRDRWHSRRVHINLSHSVSVQAFQPEVHETADVLAADEEGVVRGVHPDVPFA
jgi:hypothetical protein